MSDAARLADEDAHDSIAHDLGSTLFVSAGAGSGKTTELVRRVVALVSAGTAIESIAAITFTEKAADELRQRVRLALLEQAADDGDGWCRSAAAPRSTTSTKPPCARCTRSHSAS